MSIKQTMFKAVSVIVICVVEVVAVAILVNQLDISVIESLLILVGNAVFLCLGVTLIAINTIFNQRGQNDG